MNALYDVAAPAKLNLFLHIVGRRPDGYHLLQSVFALIDWCDSMHFEVRGDGGLARHDLSTALPSDDLCLRAARALQSESATPMGVDISIDKRVPWGAGLGGGSSDAASTLLALNRLWRLHWPRARLAALALRLGADVPFFLCGSNALVEGIGERLTPVRLPRSWLAVLKPAAAIETRKLFASPLLTRDSEAVILVGSSADGIAASDSIGTRALRGFGRNDLQPAAVAECAEVAQAAIMLEKAFGNSRMTGSGSAVFATAGMADAPSASLPAQWPAGWVGRMCRSLEAHPLAGWLED
jgi:4-diphosphocytidyl-2-C-methyl-D-erythritol kinase